MRRYIFSLITVASLLLALLFQCALTTSFVFAAESENINSRFEEKNKEESVRLEFVFLANTVFSQFQFLRLAIDPIAQIGFFGGSSSSSFLSIPSNHSPPAFGNIQLV